MNRKDFFKSLGIGLAALPFALSAKKKDMTSQVIDLGTTELNGYFSSGYLYSDGTKFFLSPDYNRGFGRVIDKKKTDTDEFIYTIQLY